VARGAGPLTSAIITQMPRSSWRPCRDSVCIAPSLLAADFGRLAEAANALEDSGADRLHVDVMDGRFVPNFTFGVDTVRMLRKETRLPLELHLMIVDPDRHLETFAAAGADGITVHYEACPHLHRTLVNIRALDCRSGAAINPSTPAGSLEDVLEVCDLALVMTIDPGFGGQQLISRTLVKVGRVREEVERQGLRTEVEVDGGVELHNARACVDAGASVLVAGTAVFHHSDGAAAGVRALRDAVTAAPSGARWQAS
jgi:ribulose-phosphate 3-epimerase